MSNPDHSAPDVSQLEDVAAVDDELEVGTMVGEYRVEGKLGEGGFGKVYRAIHPVIGKRAAIKVLNREFSANPAVVSRFVSEARAVNQIRHRNIIDIFAFGTLEGGLQYFVMELLDGTTLDEYLEQRGRLSPAEALPILKYVARALDAAHEAGIAHRDLKPENIFLASDDEGGIFPKLLDFGIAKLMGDETVSHKTRTGAAMGTPLYMSPEQCHGKNVDHRTDIYSFGVMTHQMLTGELPFDGDSMMELMLKHVQEPPPPMSQVAPDLPVSLDQPVMQMLAKLPADRPTSLVQAVEVLSGAAQAAGFDVPARSVLNSNVAVSVASGGDKNLTPAELAGATIAASPGVTEVTTSPTGGVSGTQPGMTLASEAASSTAGGGLKTGVIVVAALVVGAGVAFAVTTGGGEEAPGPEPSAAAATAAPASAEPEAPVPDPAPTAEPSATASALPSAAAAPPVAPAGQPAPPPPPVKTVAPPAPPPPPPPPPPAGGQIPDDLEF